MLEENTKIEKIFSDTLSKLIRITNKTSNRKKHKSRKIVIKINEKNDCVLNEKLSILKDFVTDLPPFEKHDFVSILMAELNLENIKQINKIKENRKSEFFYIKTENRIHKILFSLWIELLTGIDIKKDFGINRDLLFELETNYRFPISSLEFISTKNMIKALSKSAKLISQGMKLVTENLESKAVGIVLSVAVPKTKELIVIKGSERFLERISPITQSS
ncbi:MAG: hypothetical protein NZ927_01655 [Candidatus Calescibacterium sp.]|nr:hypothetical protein [Candidatus Calescibacterium sp.]MCX7734777.1 hypothetical protein [bacterium]MDW8087368.1 hypothetical protein [Candidatus Calescibacterium sp.]